MGETPRRWTDTRPDSKAKKATTPENKPWRRGFLADVECLFHGDGGLSKEQAMLGAGEKREGQAGGNENPILKAGWG
jgi:hypothetical protein